MTRAMTRVANLRDGGYDPANPAHVYIGRPIRRASIAAVRAGSIYANRHRIGPGISRQEAIDRYRHEVDRIPGRATFIAVGLRDKVLWCWCAPRPCHGDYLAALANGTAA